MQFCITPEEGADVTADGDGQRVVPAQPFEGAFLDLPFLVLASLLLRWLVSLWGYSGQASPPLFGDFEAQRHWMEITWNLPIGDWYRQTPENDLQYWGLDYPPLTAYVSWACGWLCGALEPASVALGPSSRGYETATHKALMRFTVLALDALVLLPAVCRLARALGAAPSAAPSSPGEPPTPSLGLNTRVACALFQPALILVDHGHFQYNGVSLGLALGACAALLERKDLLASALFCLSLNFKQMSLYYAPVFFCHLLVRCLARPGLVGTVVRLGQVGAVVVATFALLWAPFAIWRAEGVTALGALGQVLTRLFPFGRGLFEDKVANVWYVLSVLKKDLRGLDPGALKVVSLGATLLLLAPVCFDLLTRTKAADQKHEHERLPLALGNSGLAFFLCSFQVHEKSFLLPLLPLVMLFPEDPLIIAWLSSVAAFSMFPLLVRDGLLVPYAVTQLVLAGLVASPYLPPTPDAEKLYEETRGWPFGGAKVPPEMHRIRREAKEVVRSQIAGASVLGMLLLHALERLYRGASPFERYPDLWPALFSLFSAAHFAAAYVYFTVWQLGIVPRQQAEGETERLLVERSQLLEEQKRLMDEHKQLRLESETGGGEPFPTSGPTRKKPRGKEE